MPVNTTPLESGKFPSLSLIAPAVSCPILPKGWWHRVLLLVWVRHTGPRVDHYPGTLSAAKLSLNSLQLCSHLNHLPSQLNLHLFSLTRCLLQQLHRQFVFQIQMTCWPGSVYRILRVKIHYSTFLAMLRNILCYMFVYSLLDWLHSVGVMVSLSSFKSFDCFTIWRRRPYFINNYI